MNVVFTKDQVFFIEHGTSVYHIEIKLKIIITILCDVVMRCIYVRHHGKTRLFVSFNYVDFVNFGVFTIHILKIC